MTEFVNPRAGPKLTLVPTIMVYTRKKVRVAVDINAESSYKGNLIEEFGKPDLYDMATIALERRVQR